MCIFLCKCLNSFKLYIRYGAIEVNTVTCDLYSMMRLYRCLYIVLFFLSLIDIVVLLPPLSVSGQQPGRELLTSATAAAYEGRVVKGSKNAIYLVKSSKKCIFPDFNTFVKMGYSLDNVTRLPDSLLDGFERGDTLPSIAMFRADDFSFHAQCDDAHRMVRLSSNRLRKKKKPFIPLLWCDLMWCGVHATGA